MVHHKRFKGKDMPIPLQYELTRDIVRRFPGRIIIDASGPGGKNAKAFLRDLHPIPFDAGSIGSDLTKKSEGLASLKTALDGGSSEEFRRISIVKEDGTVVDYNKHWGLIRTPDINELFAEMVNYQLEDKKIVTDQVMSVMMAVDWLMMRRPKNTHIRAVDMDLLTARVENQAYTPGYFPYTHKNRAVDI
jgi:hypothetical protein